MSIVLPIYGFATLDKYSICCTKVHWWLSVAACSQCNIAVFELYALYIVAHYVWIDFELSLLFLTLDGFCLCHMCIYYSIHTVEDKAEKNSYEHPLVEL